MGLRVVMRFSCCVRFHMSSWPQTILQHTLPTVCSFSWISVVIVFVHHFWLVPFLPGMRLDMMLISVESLNLTGRTFDSDLKDDVSKSPSSMLCLFMKSMSRIGMLVLVMRNLWSKDGRWGILWLFGAPGFASVPNLILCWTKRFCSPFVPSGWRHSTRKAPRLHLFLRPRC